MFLLLLFAFLPATLAIRVHPWDPVAKSGVGWVIRHQNNLRQTRQFGSNISLVFYGDSITEGWKGPGRRIWPQFYGNLSAVNYGIGGDRTENLVYRVQSGELEGVKPKVIVLKIGTNNLWLNTVNDTVKGVRAVIDAMRRMVPGAKILHLAILPRFGWNNEGGKAKQVNEELAKFRIKSVTYLDMKDAFENKNGTLKNTLFSDGLHLTEAGYLVWAKTMKSMLDKLMKN